MKNKLLVAALLCAAVQLNAQKQDTTRILKRDFGFNTNLILATLLNSGSAPFSVMYKTYTQETKAIRLGLSGSFSNSNTSGTAYNSSYSTSKNGEVSLTIGLERQRHLSGKWDYYYGTDMLPSYNFASSSYYQPDSTQFARVIQTSKSSTWGVSLRPFIGIRFNINKRVYLATEASFIGHYARTDNTLRNYANTNIIAQDTHTDVTSLSLSPTTGIFLFYRF